MINKYFDIFPIIETENFVLRDIKVSDAEDLYEYYADEEVYKYLDWHGPSNVEDARNIIESWNKGYRAGYFIRWGIIDKKTNKIVGTFFYNIQNNAVAEAGYELSRKYWRKGIMSEVLTEVIPVAFENLKLIRIQATVAPPNIASKNLLKKFGFQEEGLLRQYEYHVVEKTCSDMLMFSLVKSDF